MQDALVSAGRLGRKTSGGFYDYAPDGTRGDPWSGLPPASAAHRADGPADAAIGERLLATIVNEAASAVADGVAPPDSIDLAMRLGANYQSGPLEWGERVGLTAVVRTLDALDAAWPDGRYRVVPLLRSLAEGSGSFFAQRP